jgi:hypothetical protein
MERKRVSLVGPTLLIGLGVILLLSNLGVLDWSLWNVLQLWPVLLIAAGLEILLGRRSVWGNLIAAFLVLLLIVGGVWLMERVDPVGTFAETIEVARPIDGAEAFILDLDPSIVNLTVRSLDDSPNLVEGTIQLWTREALDERFTAGERARLFLGVGGRQNFGPISMGRAATWRLRINPDVPTRLNADFGIGEANLRLADLSISDADIDFGIGRVEMALSPTTPTEVHIDGGIGTVRIIVPRDLDLGVRIITDAGLVTRNLPNRYTRDGETYTSPNWAEAGTRATVTINLGIGTITVVESGGGR